MTLNVTSVTVEMPKYRDTKASLAGKMLISGNLEAQERHRLTPQRYVAVLLSALELGTTWCDLFAK